MNNISVIQVVCYDVSFLYNYFFCLLFFFFNIWQKQLTSFKSTLRFLSVQFFNWLKLPNID